MHADAWALRVFTKYTSTLAEVWASIWRLQSHKWIIIEDWRIGNHILDDDQNSTHDAFESAVSAFQNFPPISESPNLKYVNGHISCAMMLTQLFHTHGS